MNHWWIRERDGFAGKLIVYECVHCKIRKRYVAGAGPRGGTKVAVRTPGGRKYEIGPVPPCYEFQHAAR